MVDLGRSHSSLVRMMQTDNHTTVACQVNSDIFSTDDSERLRMLREFNPYVCEAFFADRVLLVEGPTEVVAVRVLLEQINKENNNSLSDLLVVDCGGKTTIPLFQRILCHFKIPYFVFHDLDNCSDVTNKLIWDEIEAARSQTVKAYRFTFNSEFETANGYKPPSADKPFTSHQQARKWLKSWSREETQKKPVVQYLREILSGEVSEDHSQEWLENQGFSHNGSVINITGDQLPLPGLFSC